MSLFLHVFASSDKEIDPAEVTLTARTSWYGEGSVTTEDDGAGWRRIVVTIPGAAKPIVLLRDTDPDTVSVLRDEQLAEHDDAPQPVLDRLRSARQVLSFEVFPETLDDDGWELLDILESYLARELDGVIVAEDAIYDADLQPLTGDAPLDL